MLTKSAAQEKKIESLREHAELKIAVRLLSWHDDADDAIGMILNWNSDEDSSGDPLDESDDDEFEVDSDSDDDIPEIQENNLSDGFADTASSESGGEDDVGQLILSTFRKCMVLYWLMYTDFELLLIFACRFFPVQIWQSIKG
eukprot:scpid104663/ scgid33328/ 